MSFNFPNHRQASQDPWPSSGDSFRPQNMNASLGLTSNSTSSLGPDSEQPPGFRNPWYSPNQQMAPQLGGPPMGTSMNHLPQQLPQLSLLQQKKQPSFANQLQTTYENAALQQNSQQPIFYPPLRADNPFNHYYTNQEVLLHHMPDRRMSAAVDGPLYNPYGNAMNLQQNASAATAHLYPPNTGQGSLPFAPSMPYNSARRSSVAAGANSYQRTPLHSRYFNGANAPPSGSFLGAQPPATVKRTPKIMKVCSKSDLKPKVHHQPKYRRRSINSIHISPVNALSVYLTESYSMCQPQKFRYSKTSNPKRVLTKPLEPKFNNGYDNVDSDYILYVNDMLGTEEGRKYVVLDILGSGTFGQVVKCQNLNNQSVVAVKVIKSKPAYLNQSLSEVKLLEFLNQNSSSSTFISLLDTFMHKEHLCLVFEILASNLYELIKQNQFNGLNMKLVKSFTKQLLEACAQLKNLQIIHCDLKPENILLCQPDKPDIKVIDFGSACFTRQTIYSYIQLRFYRSPEVILGLPYTESIDMWSLGCIVGELFLGLPMFPGASEYNQIFKITDMLGNPPRHMIEVGRNAMNYFEKCPSSDASGKPSYRLKSHEDYLEFLKQTIGKDEVRRAEQPNKEYFNDRLLKDIILNYKMPSRKMTQMMIDREMHERHLLVDFLAKVLNFNPLERLTPQEALKHPFVSESTPAAHKTPLDSSNPVAMV